MSSKAPPPSGQSGVRRMLVLFGILAIIGVLALAKNVVIGLALLVVAEGFFAVAYRRFSKGAKGRA